MRILLIDDDAFLRDMYATKFTEVGDEVSVAKSANEAMSIVAEQQFDVVVVDMVMPGMTGVDFIKAVRANTDTKNTQCIVLSNHGEQSDIDAALAVGAAGYIIKAESIPSEVVEKVHALVQ